MNAAQELSRPVETGANGNTRRNTNLRTPAVMAAVKAQTCEHYESRLIAEIRQGNGVITVGSTSVRLATTFGFCYGVQRAIDLAYATRRIYPQRTIYLLGEIIHNAAVNGQLAALGIRNLLAPEESTRLEDLRPDDVVIIPAFGAEKEWMERLQASGCRLVDTTCGDVMSVWRRVKRNASLGITTVIHGKAQHEETRGTASRAAGADGGHYLVVLDLAETDLVCAYIRGGRDREKFLERFQGAYSCGFDPDLHLRTIGVANQTTMLSSETQELQRRLQAALEERDGDARNFHPFDGICRATQDRQDALRELLKHPLDLLLIIGDYHSSNTTHLAEIGECHVPTFFISNSECLLSTAAIRHFDRGRGRERVTQPWLPPTAMATIGVTAGASCPDVLIEETIVRLFALRSIECAKENPALARTRSATTRGLTDGVNNEPVSARGVQAVTIAPP